MISVKSVEEMKKSFFKYVIPAMVATLLSGLYTIVDGYFVGNAMGDIGLAAINIVVPIAYLLLAVGIMIGVGGSVIMSTFLGAGETDNFNRAKVNTFMNLIIASILITIILLLLKNRLIYWLGGRGEIFKEADSYITIIILGGAFQIISSGSAPLMRNVGKPILAMIFMGMGLIVNIVLDYFFIMVFRWGMFGAALATILAEASVSIVYIYYLFIRKENRVKIRLKMFNAKMSLKALTIGLSPFGLIMAPSLIVIINNLQCLRYGGEIAVSAYSVANYIYISTLLFFEGISEGCQPMISYFRGAKEHKAMKGVFKKGILVALILDALFITTILIFKNHIGLIFGASKEANIIIAFATPIISFAFTMQSIVRLGTAYFYSSGRSVYSTILTYIDPLCISPLCILILPIFFGLDGVFFAMAMAQFILLILFLIIYYRTRNDNIFNKAVYENI